MLIVGFTLIGLLLVVAQTTVCMVHPVWLPAPDLYYILVAYLAYRVDILRSLIILFFLGCFLDVFSGIILGMYSLVCFGAFLLLRYIAEKLPVNESLYQVPLIGVSYLVVSWIAYLLMSLMEPGGLIPWTWWKMIIRAGLVILFAYPLFHFFEFFKTKAAKGFFSWKRMRVRSDNRYRK